jgi:hypothetical protein
MERTICLARINATLCNSHGGFEESAPPSLPLLANSHMHLLEACLEWMDRDNDRAWSELAEEIVELALRRFHDPAAASFASSSAATGRWCRARLRMLSSQAINMSGHGCCCAGRSASTTRARTSSHFISSITRTTTAWIEHAGLP